MQNSCGAAENVAAKGKAIKDLGVVAVEILPAKLEGMFATDDGEVVFEIKALSGARSEEERLPKSERGENLTPVSGIADKLIAERGRVSYP